MLFLLGYIIFSSISVVMYVGQAKVQSTFEMGTALQGWVVGWWGCRLRAA